MTSWGCKNCSAPFKAIVIYSPLFSSRGPCLAINCFHTYTPPYNFFHIPSSTLICFIIFLHSFLSISSVFFYHHFSKIFAILFSFLLASFISPTTFQNVISSISSPHPFQKINFAKYIAKHLCHQKNTNCLQTICPFLGQKIEQQQHHSPPSFHHFYHIYFSAWSSL